MSRFAPASPKAKLLAILLAASGILSATADLRAEDVAKEQLRKEILEKKGIDATRWGEDIRNPFTNLTAEGKAKLKKQGVDVERLVKLKTVLITGNYCGANSKTFVNRDPDTILVLGKGFITHGAVYSFGPVLGVEDAHIMGSLTGADLVWFVEKAWPRFQTRGAPLLVAPDTWQPHDRKTHPAGRDDYGWRRPDDFLKPPALKDGAELPPLAASDAEKKKKDLQQFIQSRRGEDVAKWCEDVVNPFKGLSEKGRAKLAARGIDARRLRKLKVVLLAGSYCGADSRDFVNRDPDTILIVGKDFITHGAVFSLGPVLAVENAHFMGDVYGADLVWFVDQTFPRGRTAGLPVILAATAHHSQMHAVADDIWYGDYGWKRPDDFLKPVPITLTRQQLDALWIMLDGGDASRSARAVKKLLAAEEHFLPYLKQRLRLPPRPTKDRVGRLLDDLDSERYPTRQAASRELERLGLLVEPELLLMLETRPTLETRRRIEQILADVKAEQKRIRRAFRALEEMDPLGSRQLLEELAEGDPDLFVTREAKATLGRKNQRGRK